MTDYKEKQNENVSAPVEEYSFVSFAKEIFLVTPHSAGKT